MTQTLDSHTGPTSLLQRLRDALRPSPEDRRAARLRRVGETCEVLSDARAVVERGWVQGRWYAAGPTAGVGGACMVGAVVHAARRRHPRGADLAAGPAIDALWDAWQESCGLGGPWSFGRAAAPDVRTIRVRDLTRWNDDPRRTREDVLGLLDLAMSHAIIEGLGRETPDVRAGDRGRTGVEPP